MMTIEEWRDIPGSDGMYQVSNLGNARSVDRITIRTSDGKPVLRRGRNLKLAPVKNGYLAFTPKLDGKSRWALIHQMVMLAFVGPLPEGMVTRHLNGDPSDNRLENLAYGTPAENTADMMSHGRHRNANKTHCRNGHEYTPENTMIENKTWRKCRTCHNANQNNRRYASRRKDTP